MVVAGDDLPITQKGGGVRLVIDGSLKSPDSLTFDVEAASESGLLCVAYMDDKVFVGDINKGSLYYVEVNEARNGFAQRPPRPRGSQ